MSDSVIKIDQLGKRYLLSHQRKQSQRSDYKRFSDVLMSVARGPLRWAQRRGTEKREEFWALKEVSIEIKPGEIVGIIGRNGAGKSTLLKVLSRITEPSEGRIEIDGRVASLLEVGTGFHPELTGRENIYLNGAIHGMSRAEIRRKFDEIVAFSEVEKFLDTPVKRYSSGMYVRLAFAVAAHLEAEILMIDEVLAVGDSGFQKKCLTRMEGITHEGRTVLFVSHNLGTVLGLCGRAFCLEKGRVVAEGPTAKVVEFYQRSGLIYQTAWKRPESKAVGDAVCFLSACTQNRGGEEASTFSCDESIRVVIEYKVLRPLNDCIFTAKIESSRGEFVFETGDTDARCATGMARNAGIFIGIFEVPNYLLSPGLYYLSIGAGVLGYTAYEVIGHVTTFEVLETNPVQPSARRVAGIISPKLKWETIQTI